jgi:hypothetical protein
MAATALTTSGCAQSCTLVGGDNHLRIEAPRQVRASVASLHLELCQEDRCRELSFPTARRKGEAWVRDGVTFLEGGYYVFLDEVDGFGGWDSDAGTSLRIQGLTQAGQVALVQEEQFRFSTSYPNGEGCEPEVLSHTTSLEQVSPRGAWFLPAHSRSTRRSP